jgi:uncharacterized protein (DUF1501 family)
MSVTRRVFLKQGGVAMVGFGVLPGFLTRAVAPTPMPNKKILVVLFQRGAMDGLNAVVPFTEANYYRLRPTIAIPRPSRGAEGTAIDLDGRFALHPSLEPLAALYRERELAIVHAVGSPANTRSHFDAQDYMESGTPGVKSTRDGWLNRHLQTNRADADSPFRAVAVSQSLPRTLAGPAPAVALANVRQFRVMAPGAVAGGFEAIYAQTVDQALGAPAQETFEAVELLRRADPARYQPANGAQYPRGRFGQSLMQVAQMIKSDIGLECAFVDSGGWDHHVNEGGVQGQLANLLRDLGQGLAAFHRDLGDRMQDVVLVTMSEFGRTAHENGNRGTDHGTATCMFVLGGEVAGGSVYGRWPGLEREQLFEGRDLPMTTDFRSVVGELVARHLGNENLSAVFPGFTADPRAFLGILKA